MKERILAESKRLFWQHGVRSVTMEEVARQLGISKKTIYQHFDDKEEILCQIIRAKAEADTAELSCMVGSTLNPIEEIMGVLEMMRQKQAQVNPNLFIDVRRHYPRAYALIRQHVDNHIMKQVLDNIQRGKVDGLYRDDINPLVLARLRIEQIELALSSEFTAAGHCDPLEIQRQLTHHFVRGMLTDKGFAIYNEYVNRSIDYNQIVYE